MVTYLKSVKQVSTCPVKVQNGLLLIFKTKRDEMKET